MNAAELWAGLSEAGLVEGAQPAPGADGSLWYVRLMLGIAGWIGALFLFAFVGVALGARLPDAAVGMQIDLLVFHGTP